MFNVPATPPSPVRLRVFRSTATPCASMLYPSAPLTSTVPGTVTVSLSILYCACSAAIVAGPSVRLIAPDRSFIRTIGSAPDCCTALPAPNATGRPFVPWPRYSESAPPHLSFDPPPLPFVTRKPTPHPLVTGEKDR